ncbi:hypothetical protein BHE74_00052030 [Ensete ventricosum]|nr:hypothetical protein BHE74_00052030 [Ensete ventricosum]
MVDTGGEERTGIGGTCNSVIRPSDRSSTFVIRRSLITPSDSWLADVANPTQVTSRTYGGHQWLYSRPDADKVGTPTCKRTPHCKDSEHGGGHDGTVEGTAAW